MSTDSKAVRHAFEDWHKSAIFDQSATRTTKEWMLIAWQAAQAEQPVAPLLQNNGAPNLVKR